MSDLQNQLQRTLGESYTLERELEGGGMARVFVALDQQLGRKVVVKTLAGDSGVSVSAERFRREIRLAASLQQANIVPVHSAGDVDGVPYYTMPFVEGESLRAHMDKRGALDVREAVNILRDVARALAFAHERGVVHRDIKPENILLSGSTAVVTDFGIAKAIEASHSQAGVTLTQLGTLLGTPAYISPEQAAGDPQIDHLADIYSLGVVAYEMLAGARPFTATAARALLAAHVNETPPPLASKREGLPLRLASLVMRCLEKEPERRPQKAGELLAELDDALHSGQTDARPKPVIAVLPLTNMSASADDEYFADGMTEDIIAQLSQIASFTVIARTSVMRFKGASKRPREIATDLGATHMVEGSVRRAGSRLRIVSKLVEARNEASLWTETFDRELADVFAIQADVAERIAAALRTQLTLSERDRISKAPTKDLAAYEAFLLGRQAFHAPPAEKHVYATAAAQFEHAIALDGAFAKAYAALAFIHAVWAQGYWGTSPRDAWPRARELAEHALALDPECGEAHLVLAVHAATFRFAWADAVRQGERAIDLEPSNSTIRANVAFIQSMCGMTSEALATARRGHELDPLSASVRFEPFILLMARRFPEALMGYEALEKLVPGVFFVTMWHAVVLVALNRHSEALELLRRHADGYSDNWSKLTTAALLAACGDNVGARSRLAQLHEREATEYMWPVGFAMAYAYLGESDRAFQYLERAYEDRAGWITFLPTGSFIDPLRGDPRLDALIRKVGAPVEQTTYRPPARAAAAIDRKSVAVLPFANLSPDPENEFFADGITDDLIAQVAKIGSLRVIARTSVMRYRGVQDAARSAAKELGVSAVVEGTVRRAGKRARIVAQLIDSSSDAPIWSETYDRDLDDVFSVQTEVATSVAQALKASLTPAEERRLAQQSTKDAKAYDLYLIGRHHYSRRTSESLKSALTHFEQAIGRDPQFAAAHAGLADAYVFAGIGYAPIPPVEAFSKAKASAQRAINLDPESPEALCAMGLALMQGDWNVSESRNYFERAIASNPNHSVAHQFLAWCLFSAGDYSGAVAPQRRALELDPLNVSLITEQGWPYTYAGLHEIARVWYRKAVDLDPGFGLGHYNIGMTLQGTGDVRGALACYQRAIECMGQSPWVIAYLAVAHFDLGDRTKAEELLASLHDQARAGMAVWLAIAMILDGIGRTEEALDALDRSFADHEPFVWGVGVEGWLQLPNARRHPRFKALLDRVGGVPHDIPRQRELLLAHAKQQGLA